MSEVKNGLWDRITAIPRPFRVISLPIYDAEEKSVGDVHVQVLTQSELMSARVEAEKWVRAHYRPKGKPVDGEPDGVPKKDEASAFDDLLQNACAVEVLFRACRRVEDPSEAHSGPKWPAFPSPGEMRKRFTNDQLGVMMREYLVIQAELGPIVASMTKGEVDAWIERIAEAGSAAPLASLSWEASSELILRMAYRLHSSSTATSSLGSQPDESTSSEPSDEAEIPDAEDPLDEG